MSSTDALSLLFDFALVLDLCWTLVLSFLLGTIPWGLIISSLFYKTDIRKHGSGNIGTTNALRTLGKVGGALVFVLDFAKGLLAGYLAGASWGSADPTRVIEGTAWLGLGSLAEGGIFGIQAIAFALAFVACICGHVFSPWLKFKGGKGVAVAVGCIIFAFSWPAVLLEIAIFVVVVALTRIVSAGSLAAAAAVLPISLWLFWGNPIAIAFFWIGALIIIWAHRGNIARLRTGAEHRFGAKKTEVVDQIVEAQAAGWTGAITSGVGDARGEVGAEGGELAAGNEGEIDEADDTVE